MKLFTILVSSFKKFFQLIKKKEEKLKIGFLYIRNTSNIDTKLLKEVLYSGVDILISTEINDKILSVLSKKIKHIAIPSKKFKSDSHLIYIDEFETQKIRSLTRKNVNVFLVKDRKLGWMISQMFPAYCIFTQNILEEIVITAPIPLTPNSDGILSSIRPVSDTFRVLELDVGIIRELYQIDSDSKT